MSTVFSCDFASLLCKLDFVPKRGKRATVKKRVLADFGTRLQSWMARRGHTNTSYSEKSGVDLSTLGKVLAGSRNVTLVSAQRYLEGLGLSMDEFYADKEFSALERAFPDEFRLLREVLTNAGPDGVRDVRRAMTHAIKDAEEARGRASPSSPGSNRLVS